MLLEDLTSTWLTGALHSTGAATGTATAIDVAPIGGGLGLVGALARVTATWAGGTGPATIIAKLPSPAEGSRFVAAALGMYRKEVCFYRDLAARAEIPHAECFYAQYEPDSDDFVLLLSDLAGDRSVDQIEGCRRPDAELAIDRLADLHAGFWSDPSLTEASWLGRLADSPFPESIAFAFDQAWETVRDRYARLIPPVIDELGGRFSALLPELTQRLSEEPCTLSHGDYRVDNMFFYDTGDLAVCDWQLVDRSRGARDVAYFLTQSLTPGLRAELEGPLLERYISRLVERGVEGYGFDVAWQDYRLAALFAFVYPVIAGGGLDDRDDRATALCGTVLERCIAAIVDLRCLELVS